MSNGQAIGQANANMLPLRRAVAVKRGTPYGCSTLRSSGCATRPPRFPARGRCAPLFRAEILSPRPSGLHSALAPCVSTSPSQPNDDGRVNQNG